MRKLSLLLIALGLVAASCNSAPVDPEHAVDAASSIVGAVDEVLEAAPPQAGLVVPAGCELEQTFDDYGFPVEIVVCPDTPSTPTTTVVVPLDEYIGSSEAQRLAVAIRNALIIDAGCATESVVALETTLAAAPRELQVRLTGLSAELAAAALVCDERWPEWQRHMEAAAVHLEDLVTFLQAEQASG